MNRAGARHHLVGNACRENGRDGIGLHVRASNLLEGRSCLGNGDDGIDLDDDGISSTTLAGNTCSSNGHEGIDNSGQGAELTGNVYGTGGVTASSRLDNFVPTAPN